MDASLHADFELLAAQQAALRRLATLVAEGAAAAELYSAVAYEAALVLDISAVILARFEPDATATVLASINEPTFPIGTNWPIDGPSVTAAVRDTGRPARVDDYSQLPSSIAASVRDSSIRTTVGVPIRVDGEVWGLLTVATDEVTPMPADTEGRLADFAELVATGISNAAARDRLHALVEQQAALGRVATLVVRESTPEEIFHVVTHEASRVLETEAVGMLRFESDVAAILVAQSDTPWEPPPLGTRFPLAGENIVVEVLRTGEAARADDWANATGPVAAMAEVLGVRSAVATPIVVEGRLWGVLIAATSQTEPLPDDTEARIAQFTELVATAIANAQSREALGVLADEQTALRRVATLVAEGAPRSDVFLAVSREVERVFSVHMETTATVVRFDPGPECVLVGSSKAVRETPIGMRWEPNDLYVSTRVLRTGRNARVDETDLAVGGFAADQMRRQGFLSQVASPIVVEGRLWGAVTVSAAETMPADTDERLERFTEIVVTAIANAESRDALGVLADEQAALRKIAVLVAQQPSPEEVFTAVTEAVGPLLGADLAAMHMFTEGTATVVAGWSGAGPMLPVGTLLPLDGDSAAARIFQTGSAARIDTYVDVDGETAGVARGLGLRSTVGAPIVVEGRLWGALMAATRGEEPLPDDAETRIAQFTELVATAVSNAESRAALGLLADEQASLRRVATLVAKGVPAPDLFTAVTEEVAHLFAGEETSVVATVIRFDPGPESVLVGASRAYASEAVGDHWFPKELYVSTRVLRSGSSARVDAADLDSVGGLDAELLRLRGFLHQVGSPVVVGGRLWGAITLNSRAALPVDVDRRLAQFTELVATAIANAESQSELAASRRRMVAAADDARRGIERNLHDGVQQQLVSIGMELGAVEDSLPVDDDLREQVAAVSIDLRSAIDDLREISRGIHPAILSHGGLAPALKTLARRSPVPAQLTTDIDGRLPERVEVAAYYVVSEALTNVARHAQASVVSVEVVERDGALELSIRDDGVGGADTRRGTGLIGLKDRVEALGGRMDVSSTRGEGTSLVVALRLAGEAELDDSQLRTRRTR